jgi:2-methylcitrate dehydratase PrpD
MTTLGQLGGFVARCGRGGIPDDVRELAALHVIDTVGAGIAGAATTEGRSLQALHDATQTDAPGSLDADIALRCAQTRLSEIDDIHLPSMVTPGGVVIPAAITIASAAAATRADDVIAAILAGYEAMTRLGRAIDGPAILYRGIWPTYLLAPVGVAAVAARLMRLDEDKASHALALALTLAAPGVGRHTAATSGRWFALGNAAARGLSAARAAQAGFTGDLNLIEGGLSGSYGITPDIAALTDGLGGDTVLREVSFKPWCAARQTMAATQALREIIAGGVTPENITAVQAFVPPPHLKMIDHGVVAGDRTSHLTSLPYNMAVAAMAPELAFDVQPSRSALPPAIRAVMDKIKVEPDERLLVDYPRLWRARVRVTAGADTYEQAVSSIPGDPDIPFDHSLVETKFLRFVTSFAGPGTAKRKLTMCQDGLASGDFSELVGA